MALQANDRLKAHYEGLTTERKEIRVLEVEPGLDKAVLVCKLRHISLVADPLPEFETISYCWGPPKAPTSIQIDTRVVAAPQSSATALLRMRLSNRPRVLWIDAICINQDSLQERSEQVALMSCIYRSATRNLIYLGEDGGFAERAIQAVTDVIADMQRHTGSLFDTLYNRETGGTRYSDSGFDKDIDFEALEHLFAMPWFGRLWVLQEATLAQISICYWGNRQFGLPGVVRAAKWLTFKFRYISQGIYDCIGWRCATEMFDFLDSENGNVSKRHLLENMVGVSQCFEKTDPKDSIYAILGLLIDTKTGGHAKSTLLEVDYSKSLAEILQDATRFALCQSGTLVMLRRVFHQTDILPHFTGFPSWAIRADVQRGTLSPLLIPGMYNASEGLAPPTLLDDISSGTDVLLTQGIVIDRILASTPTCEGRHWHEYQGYHAWLLSAKSLVMQHGSVQRDDSLSTFVAMAFALTAGEAYNKLRAHPEDVMVLARYIASIGAQNDKYQDEDDDVGETYNEHDMDKMYSVSRVLYCVQRKFFVTIEGRVGLGPRSMEPDDKVVVLRGGHTPFVMRACEGVHKLLGPAYVHGVMDGEAIESRRRDNDLDEVVFIVR